MLVCFALDRLETDAKRVVNGVAVASRLADAHVLSLYAE